VAAASGGGGGHALGEGGGGQLSSQLTDFGGSSEADSPGSWWGPHEGGWINKSSPPTTPAHLPDGMLQL
jgi:hypothetical protein